MKNHYIKIIIVNYMNKNNVLSKSKFKIINIKLLNTHIYNLSLNTDCTICRCNLNSESIYAQEKCIDSYVVSGLCGHSFHYECINPWVSSQPNCPLCSAKWCYQIKNS